MILKVRDLNFSYKTQSVLNQINYDFVAGNSYAIVGASGAGKSTFLHLLAGLKKPDSGVIQFHGEDMTCMSRDAKANIRRRKFGFVFQNSELIPELNLLENVALPLLLNGFSKKESYFRASELLERLGIEQQSKKIPQKVSGGQLQRAGIARAVVHQPEIIFADEPTGSLDHQNSMLAQSLLLEAAQAVNACLITATHNLELAESMNSTIEIRDGVIIDQKDESQVVEDRVLL